MNEIKATSELSLRRCFRMRETITITVGTVIGVGLFTVGANVVGLLGPMVIWATFIAMLISIYPALLYAEMGSSLPYAGGTYQYASIGIGKALGMLAGWNFIISMVSVASGEALAFSFYIRTLFTAIGIPLPLSDTLLAALAVAFFILLAIGGVELTGRLQNGFMFFFWGVTIIWIFTMLPTFHFTNFSMTSITDSVTFSGFIPCIALIWWCFAGFETCCAMGEEILYPHINIPRALFLAPFIVFAVTGLFQWVLLAIIPADGFQMLAIADAPYAEGMKMAGILGFPLILLCIGITFGGDFSTLNASITTPARYLFSMARDGALPKLFSWVHPRYQTPTIAILCLGILMLLLIGTHSINYIASLSLFATLFYYIIGMFAACGLRIKQPLLARPYRAPLIKIGAPCSILIYLFMMTQLEPTAIIAGLIWCALGLLIFFFCNRCQKSHHLTEVFDEVPPPDIPPQKEKQHMDREFHIWCIVVSLAVIIVCLLYLIAYL